MLTIGNKYKLNDDRGLLTRVGIGNLAGQEATIVRKGDMKHGYLTWYFKVLGDANAFYACEPSFSPLNTGIVQSTIQIGKNMKDDIKNFIMENRTIIYWLAILIVADQWLFEGKFRDKLHELFNALIAKVKKQLD